MVVELGEFLVLVDDQFPLLLDGEDRVEGLAQLGLGDQRGQVLQGEVLFVDPLFQLLHVVPQPLDVHQVVLQALDLLLHLVTLLL